MSLASSNGDSRFGKATPPNYFLPSAAFGRADTPGTAHRRLQLAEGVLSSRIHSTCSTVTNGTAGQRSDCSASSHPHRTTCCAHGGSSQGSPLRQRRFQDCGHSGCRQPSDWLPRPLLSPPSRLLRRRSPHQRPCPPVRLRPPPLRQQLHPHRRPHLLQARDRSDRRHAGD